MILNKWLKMKVIIYYTMYLKLKISVLDILQDSLDISSSDDISAAIDRFEKLLNTDLKYTDSFK